MKYILTGLILLVASGLYSQEVVLDKNVEEQYKEEKGPNMRHYSHLFIGAGLISDLDEEEGTKIEWYRSDIFMIGHRYKLKLAEFYAMGMDIDFRSAKYFFEDRNANPFTQVNPLTYQGDDLHKQKLIINSFGVGVFQRINVGKRGNTLGKYLDTGIRGHWNFDNIEALVIRRDDDLYPEKRSRIRNKGLRYIEPLSWGIVARLGYNKFALQADYRMSDLFREVSLGDGIETDIPELPRLSFSLQYVLD